MYGIDNKDQAGHRSISGTRLRFWSRWRCGASIGLCLLVLLSACNQDFTVSVNNQAVYDPDGRLVGSQAIDADLQGCINYALMQQGLQFPIELAVLSCTDSDIDSLENIGTLQRLRFLDLSNNDISNITPLEDLKSLAGLNLNNNAVTDVGPLFNLPGLTAVSLLGNNGIACSQIEALQQRMGDNLTPPDRCRD